MNKHESSSVAGRGIMPVLVGLWVLLPQTCRGQVVPTPSGADCQLIVDASNSVVELEQTWNRILSDELPMFVIAQQCVRLTVFTFAEDGWLWNSAAVVRFPPWINEDTRPIGEASAFRNVRDAVERRRDAHALRKLDTYENDVRDSLAALDTVQVLPTRHASGTDVGGMLKRLSGLGGPRPVRAIVITDLADTNRDSLPKISAPQGDVIVVLLLAPSKPGDDLRVTGHSDRGSDQYALRVRQMEAAAPWVRVVPFFATNVANLFGPSKIMLPSREP